MYFRRPPHDRPVCTENDRERNRADGQPVEVLARTASTVRVRVPGERFSFVALPEELHEQ